MPETAAPAKPGRILAIDLFRGLTIAFMIIVNTPGNGERCWLPLRHAAWHGFTPTDLVFPSFLFIIGTSAWFSLRKFANQPLSHTLPRIWRRTTLLFLIGMFMWYIPGFIVSLFKGSPGAFLSDLVENIRILGVLGRLALCFGIGSSLALLLPRTALLWTSALLLLGYWAILYTFGTGPDPYSLQTNAALRLDLWLLGPNHLYHGESVDGRPFAFDPEGLLSTLPAIVTYILGYLTGHFLDTHQDRLKALGHLFPAALLLIASGWIWSEWFGFPINKKIWSSSFTLYAGGFSLLLLGLSVWVADVQGWGRSLRFFEVFGRNPLLAYLTSELGVTLLFMIPAGGSNAYEWLYRNLCVPIAGDSGAGSFLFSLGFMLANWIISWAANKRGWLLKV